MSHESDALLEYIAQQVHGRVPPDQERLVIELVARTLTMMMNTPDFVNRLLIVQQLNQEVYLLQQALLAQQRKAPPRKPAARKQAAKKKAAVKMGPVKVAKRRPVPRGTNKAFKKGAAGL
jgi:DNA primase